ncbi:hypothetical protein [Tamlana sp. I1]|uniref:hypothetical protein n=1 Tax=Tamlana sp. I1 TaxID=2762061 RepID=UPI00188F300D|nr:hypothetical protein [Tamlana sp. I1]
MNNREEILFHIKHYQSQLNEAYSLLDLIEKGGLKGNTQTAENSIAEIKKHLKIVCFFTSCFLDIASSLRGLIDCETNWERKFYLKSGFVVIYESIKTFGKHQKKIRYLINSDFPELESEYLTINKNLRKLKKEHKYENLISTFRNKAGAHYDEDFIIYFENLKNIDKPISVKTISDFSNFLMKLIIFWSDLIDVFKAKTEKEMNITPRKN